MEAFFELINGYFDILVKYFVLFIEVVGVSMLIYAVISALIGLFKKAPHVRLKLAEGLALALEFKLGAELLNTVIVRDWEELGILGAIILLRAALTFLIQWEIRIERKNGNMTPEQEKAIKTPLKKNENTQS